MEKIYLSKKMKVIQMSIKNYQGSFYRTARSSNPSIQPKQMNKTKNRGVEWEEKIIDWVTFYRRNVHRFIEHYCQIKLHWYQILWIYFMSISDSFVSIASRASAKSWLIALFAIARAILYPNSEVSKQPRMYGNVHRTQIELQVIPKALHHNIGEITI